MLKIKPGLRKDLIGYCFVLPALIIFGLFKIWPMIWGGVLSFYSWDGFSEMSFVGLENYRVMLTQDEIFPKVIRNTLTYAIGIIAGNIAVGLALALLVNRGLRGRGIFRTIFFLPPIMSFVMVGLLWTWIYNPEFGIINAFLSSIGLDSLRESWLGNPKTALPALILIDVWKWSGWHMVIYLAGLQTISADVIDAAKVDGATGFNRFRYITFPLLRSYTFMNIILITVGAFNTFDLVYVTTRGGPYYATHMLLTYVHLVAFRYRKIGYAAAMTYFLFIIVFCISMINMFVWRKREGFSRTRIMRRAR
jgi:ABC-type sugar transport system permease subunit